LPKSVVSAFSLQYFLKRNLSIGCWKSSASHNLQTILNPEYITQALAIVGNPNVLVNIISRRVRELNAHGKRPLIDDTVNLGVADIALLEIIHGKMEYSISKLTVEEEEVVSSPRKKRRL
jgi:DNA-directed RNA polymerase subunit omega